MNKIFSVIRREFIERVRTKAFLIATILLPLLMIGLIVGQVAMMQGGDRTQALAFVDATTDGLGESIESGLSSLRFSGDDGALQFNLTRVPAANRVDAVRDSLVSLTGFSKKERPESFDGVLVVTDETYTTGAVEYLGANAGSLNILGRLRGTVSGVLMRSRLARSGVDPMVVAQALVPANISSKKVTDGVETGESGAASLALGYGMGFILYMAILLLGQQTASSVIEEKTSRIMEVLASSLTPFQMLIGKIVGVGATGLLQMTIWGGTLYLLGSQRALIGSVLGVDTAALSAMPIPTMPLDVLLVFLAYFGLGFFMYGALYAMVGSLVNSVQEMQQFILPVTLPVIFGFFGMMAVINDPQSTLGIVFSFIPFFAPFVMPVRWAMSSVPVGELALSLAAMVLGVLGAAWVAGRIYRIGILMYGKKPSFREIGRWITTK
jgi:ABC-2 type transport system permease protein